MMGFLILGLVLLFLLAIWWVPRGTVAHELFGLPGLWYRNFQVDLSETRYQSISYGSHRRQYLLMIKEKEDAPRRRSIIVFFHGGAWRYGRPEFFLSYAAYFAARGYGVVLPSLRRQPDHTFAHMREDLASILKKVREISGPAGWEDRSWFVAGMSSGGHLASHTFLDPGLKQHIPHLKGAFLLAAPLALDELGMAAIRRKLAGEPGTEAYHSADPLEWLDENRLPPLLLVHGTHDGLVPMTSSRKFLDKAKNLGHDHLEWITLEKGSHLDAVSWSYAHNELSRRLEAWLTRVDSLKPPA